jgi:hypothetical protein
VYRTAFASAGEKLDGRLPPFLHLTATFAWKFIVVIRALRIGDHMITELKSIIEGVYILDEWNIDGTLFRPPAVEGRFVILNGNIMTILIDTTQESKNIYSTMYGVYSLTPE